MLFSMSLYVKTYRCISIGSTVKNVFKVKMEIQEHGQILKHCVHPNARQVSINGIFYGVHFA